MKRIKLYGKHGEGKFALVDDDVAAKDYVANNKWTINKLGYVKMSSGQTLLHQVVRTAPNGLVLDHSNHDKLDNRRANLRICSRQENVMNRRKSSNNTSGYKGVTRYGKAYKAQIGVNKKLMYLGLFESKHEAARAYNEAALLHHGEFACLNVVPSETR